MIAGSALGLLVVPRAPSAGSGDEERLEVRLLDEALPQDASLEKAALTRIRALSTKTFSLKMPDGAVIAQSLSKWGGEADEERLKRHLIDALDASSPLRRHISALYSGETEKPPLALPVSYHLHPERAARELLRIKARFDRRAKSARLNIQTRKVVPHLEGRALDVDATLLRMDQALAEGRFTADAVVQAEKPRVLAEALAGLEFKSVMGHFETRYSKEEKVRDRTFNLRLAAQRLDGTVLLPGEEFDFNDIVGPRDEASGYKVATVIADGELVDGIGGGTCQISGTLHGAAFFAGLEIVERYPHTRPSSYIKMGMDATVVYPTINFRFKNQYDFPVAIHESVEDGVVRAEILGPSQDQVVTLIRKVDEAIPYEQLERKDDRLPSGARILAQRGIPGFRLHRYRTIRHGSHTVREKWRDIYPPTPQVIRIGTGPATLSKASSVGTPEYLADEVLILTQRRPIDGKPGEHAENREPGKYGEKGWTREAGMPFWEE
jgi:vancomycin resistance protein YoaR